MNQTNTWDKGDGRSPLALQNLRILLVEDDPHLNEILTDFLTLACEAEVICVKLAAEALEAIQAQKPDILITNIVLPDETGYSLIQKVRSLEPEQGGQTPAIAITAAPSATNRTRILEAGFQGYCFKPFLIKELVELIATLVS